MDKRKEVFFEKVAELIKALTYFELAVAKNTESFCSHDVVWVYFVKSVNSQASCPISTIVRVPYPLITILSRN